jgi:hypothetical protein
MPIELLVTTTAAAGRAGGVPSSTTHVMQLAQQRQSFTFPSGTEPASVTLDPNAWVVMRATLEKK